MKTDTNIISNDKVNKWLERYHLRFVKTMVERMEAKEDWTISREKSAEMLRNVAELLVSDHDYHLIKDKDDTEQVDNVIYLLAHLPASMSYRIINLAVKRQSDFTEIITDRAYLICQNRGSLHPEARVILDRIIMSLRQRCFSVIFGANRRQKILALLNRQYGIM